MSGLVIEAATRLGSVRAARPAGVMKGRIDQKAGKARREVGG